jgi:phospholipid-binding lipoprotein MlaA
MMPLRFSSLFLISALALLAGCASGPQAIKEDPLEPWNRQVFAFNDAVDRAVLKPVAITYQKITPKPVRNGVRNFFGNLKDGWSVVNNALQFKGQNAADSLSRFGINTFLGLGGVFDIATELGIERHSKDFGHTLGYWGVPAGPYLVLPLLGPSTLRDTAALPVDNAGNLTSQLTEESVRNNLLVLRVVSLRANLLGASAMLDEVALDKYSFARDSYLQYRRNAIYDGNPPDLDESYENETDQAIPLESEKKIP